MERIAVIDLGSNSIRFIIMQIGDKGSYKLIYSEKKSIRLAEGMTGESRMLTEAAQQRALECLKVYAHIMKVHHVSKVEAVATAAVRNARNGASFIKRVRLLTGIPMTIISGREEAALGFSGVIHTIDMSRFLLFDLGGASCEISLVSHKKRLHSVSIPYGAVTLTGRFHSSGSVSSGKINEIRSFIRKKLNEIPWFPKESIPVIGVGGTVRNLAKIEQRASSYPLHKLHNYKIATDRLDELINFICHRSLEERKRISGLSTERADIIIAGALFVGEIVRKAHARYLTVSGCGLREGLFFHYYDPIYDKNENYRRNMLISSVRNYLNSIPLDYRSHYRYVTAMAVSMYDQLQPVHNLPPRMRKLLTAASLMHDTGILINYYSHARQSAHIMANAQIFGFSQSEQIMCALICAFHHGYSGKMLKAFKSVNTILTTKEMEEVRILSFFLMIAEGLDESYEESITKIICNASPGAIDVRIYTTLDNFDVPAHAIAPFMKAGDKIFGRHVIFQWFPGSRGANELKKAAEQYR